MPSHKKHLATLNTGSSELSFSQDDEATHGAGVGFPGAGEESVKDVCCPGRGNISKRAPKGDLKAITPQTRALLQNLGYGDFTESISAERQYAFADGELVIDPAEDGMSFQIRNSEGHHWFLESRIILTPSDLDTLCHLIARMAPPGATASLQADGHSAGNVFVGLVLVYDGLRIPINLVSGDIGCGLTLIPLMNKEGEHLQDMKDMEYYTYVLGCMRRSLKRGRVAEQGLSGSRYLEQACAFYGETELDHWLGEMKYILDTMNVKYGSSVLDYIGTFAQSLGSSGNHFMELATDDHNKHWIVVHSGSRALGSTVYSIVAEACRNTEGGYEIATGRLAEFYSRAYDALNKFAKMNRVICAVSVLDDMGLETSASALRDGMERSQVFAPAIARAGSAKSTALMGLLGGLTHNGLKAFVNVRDRKIMYVLSKGAIAVDCHSSSAIVALRAGEGCIAFTLVDPDCPWRDVPLQQVKELGYDQFTHIFNADEVTKEEGRGIVFAGHGAGRTQGTSVTARMSNFDDLAAFFARNDMVANMAPGMLGDNPEIAYKPSSQILPTLPLDIACTVTKLKTRVSHKEGMTYTLIIFC